MKELHLNEKGQPFFIHDATEIATEALDEACAYIQRKLGITTGDLASHFFSDGVVVGIFKKYIDEEVYWKTKDQ